LLSSKVVQSHGGDVTVGLVGRPTGERVGNLQTVGQMSKKDSSGGISGVHCRTCGTKPGELDPHKLDELIRWARFTQGKPSGYECLHCSNVRRSTIFLEPEGQASAAAKEPSENPADDALSVASSADSKTMCHSRLLAFIRDDPSLKDRLLALRAERATGHSGSRFRQRMDLTKKQESYSEVFLDTMLTPVDVFWSEQCKGMEGFPTTDDKVKFIEEALQRMWPHVTHLTCGRLASHWQ
jgi:hypothetical protein